MGQYWMVVNLDKKEFILPHALGCGLKLWEQLANHPGTGAALLVLCAAMPVARGGGDFDLEKNWHGPERKFPEHNTSPGPMPEDYAEVAKMTIGRWAGDRIALVGDYAERTDLAEGLQADLIYSACKTEGEFNGILESLEKESKDEKVLAGRRAAALDERERLIKLGRFRDVSGYVATVIEHELGGKYTGDGWRHWVEKEPPARKPKEPPELLTVAKGCLGFLEALPKGCRPDQKWLVPLRDAIQKEEDQLATGTKQ